MFTPEDHVIHLADGLLSPHSSTTREAVSRIVSRALTATGRGGIVVHFHGGLVSEKSARETAEKRLYPLYAEKAEAYPIFFIWESGLFETPINNLHEIVREGLFREFVKKTAEWVLKTIPHDSALKSAGTEVDRLRKEFDLWFDGRLERPPGQLEVAEAPKDEVLFAKGTKGLAFDDRALEDDILESIREDDAFRGAVEATYRGLLVAPAPGILARRAAGGLGSGSLISDEAAERLFGSAASAKGVSPIEWWGVAKAVFAILIRVVGRLRQGRAHGVYGTLVEEVLRELYVDKIGRTGWWDRMKGDTADAFKSGQDHGGTAFLTELQRQLEGVTALPKITLVGHSTGAIYICNLLKAAGKRLPGLQFDVIFEAPAVTHETLAATVADHGCRIRNFRQFGMRDSLEASDVLVPVIYRRSLLYFVSGMLESEPDEPIVGMSRYLDKKDVYSDKSFPHIAACRRFYERYPECLVWSVCNNGPGRTCRGETHGAFDDQDPATMDSIKYILLHGFQGAPSTTGSLTKG